jgi:asparagine synthase (glutamine-hydrolysing)
VKLLFGERLDEANSTLPVKYWSVEDVIAKGKIAPFKGTLEEATDVLEQLLKDAVALRMISDVPLGAFLSGGIDSSLVVALMQSLSSQPVKTFTIGFSEESYNEAIDAKKVAHYLGTEHTELYVTYNDAMSVIPNLSEVYDEPFAESSQIPTFLVSKLARSHVTVSLSGDGGDELFGGYTRYFSNYNPMTQNQLISSICKLIVGIDSHYCSLTAPFNHMRGYNRAKKTLFSGAQETYLYEVSTFTEPEKIIQSDAKHPTNFSCVNDLGFEYKELMMYLDTITYLPDDILVKLDRASMAVGLEGRVPILDHRVVEFAWQLPISYKISPGYSKILLKQLLYRYAPEELFNRPKQGFGIPVGLWLQGPLKEWASELLSETVVKKTSYFDPKAVQSLWKLHLSGKKDMQAIIWSILMFQMWRNKYK